MELNGKEFLRKVSIEQDKAELTDQIKKLDEQKKSSIKKDPEYFDSHNINEDSAYLNISDENIDLEDENNLLDIKLDNKNDSSNKKKIILLGVGLIILFIITIIIMRVISNSDQEKELKVTAKPTQTIKKDKILDKIDSIEEYQKIIEKKPQEVIKNIEKKDIILPEVTEKLSPIIEEPVKKRAIKKDLFELEKKTVPKIVEKIKPKKVVKPKVEPKVKSKIKPKKTIKEKVIIYSKPRRKMIVPPPVETNFTKKTTKKTKKFYVQIGAFTKKPSKKLLKSISNKGYNYTIRSIKIKGRVYNKVLIGSYSSKKAAKRMIDKIRKDFKNPNAYILSL